jgi:hypothetical protein
MKFAGHIILREETIVVCGAAWFYFSVLVENPPEGFLKEKRG